MGISPFEVAEKAQRTYESSFDRRADSPVAVAQATVARSPYADIDIIEILTVLSILLEIL